MEVVHAATLLRLRQEECPRYEVACPVQPGLQSKIMSPNKTKHTQQGEGGWRDGSADKSTSCSYKGPGFGSQHPHTCSEQPMSGSQGCRALFRLLWLMYTCGSQICSEAALLSLQ